MSKNYKNECFYPVENIQQELKKISNRLEENFYLGNYISVNKFKRGVKDKHGLTDFIEKMDKELPPKFKQKNKKHENDYSGIYLFAKKEDGVFKFEYVGISQQVIRRLIQHVTASDSGSSTWAFLMAKVKHNKRKGIKTDISKNNFGNDNNAINAIRDAIKEEQEETISEYFVTYYPIYDNFLLSMVEPYVACDLECKWNSFETH